MALQSNGIIFLDDNKNFSVQGNTVLANNASILIANNDSVSGGVGNLTKTVRLATAQQV